MKFKWYLTEKVRKNELRDIFNDDSVLVGGEFEFYMDDMANYSTNSWGDMDALNDQWRNYKQELQDWAESVEEEQEKLSAERSKLEDEKETSELEDIPKFQQEIKELEDELEDEDISDDRIKEIKSSIEDKHEDITTWQERISEIDDRLGEIEDEEMDVFNTNEFPYAPFDLRDFVYEMSGGELDLRQIDPIDYLERPDIYDREIDRFEPTEEMFEVDEDDYLDEALRLLEREFDFTIRDSQSPGKNDNFWGLSIDSSVPPIEGGVELISPPLPMPLFIEKAEEIMDYISTNGSTDHKCGFHVHLSIDGINLEDELDVVKLFLFHDENKVYQAFKERKGSRYALSVKQKIEDARFEPDDLRKLIDVDKLEQKLSTSKFYGINLSYLDENHIEFRYMGGADYEDKWENIKENLGNYAYNLKLACDPQFKRQEYIKKLNRAINRLTEKWKPYYLRSAIYTYLKFEIIDKFDTNGEGVSTLINVLNRELQDTLNDVNVNLRTAFKNFRDVDYEDKEVASVAGAVLRRIKSESGINVKNDEVYDYIKNSLLDSKKLIKKLRKKFKNISRFL